jgi:hypothetical protein
MELIVLKEAHEIITLSTEVDVYETGCRYKVNLGYDAVRRVYFVSSPNYFVSLETSNPTGCADKLMEHGISTPDANAIGEIVAQLLLPLLKDKVS